MWFFFFFFFYTSLPFPACFGWLLSSYCHKSTEPIPTLYFGPFFMLVSWIFHAKVCSNSKLFILIVMVHLANTTKHPSIWFSELYYILFNMASVSHHGCGNSVFHLIFSLTRQGEDLVCEDLKFVFYVHRIHMGWLG